MDKQGELGPALLGSNMVAKTSIDQQYFFKFNSIIFKITQFNQS